VAQGYITLEVDLKANGGHSSMPPPGNQQASGCMLRLIVPGVTQEHASNSVPPGLWNQATTHGRSMAQLRCLAPGVVRHAHRHSMALVAQ
jgi:acetylornithine deacetylase/succinyl-diaminopimelate desuccinylase-like protein